MILKLKNIKSKLFFSALATLSFLCMHAQDRVPEIVIPPDPFNAVNAVAISPNSNIVAVTGASVGNATGFVAIFDTKEGKIINRVNIDKAGKSIAYTADGKQLIIGYAGGGGEVWNAADFEKQNTSFSVIKSEAYAISADAKMMVSCNNNAGDPEIILQSFSSGKKIKRFKIPAMAQSFAFAEDGRTIYAGLITGDITLMIDVETGNTIGRFIHKPADDEKNDISIKKLVPVNNGNILITGDNKGNIRWWNTNTGEETGNGQYGKNINDIILMPDKKQIVICSGENTEVYGTVNFIDINSKEEIKSMNNYGKLPVTGLAISKDGKFLFSTGYEKTFKIWDLSQENYYGDPLAQMVFLGNSDWLALDSYGRFEGTNETVKKIYFEKWTFKVPLEAVYENFQTPKLLSRLLAGEKFESLFVDINRLKKPPVVKISVTEDQRNLSVEDDMLVMYSATKEQVTVKVQADCPTDGVTEIRLFQNGKLVETTRNLVVEDEKAAEKSAVKTFNVMLAPGENRFKAIALNTERTESKPAELLVSYKPTNNVQPATSTATLHLIVIGINTYKNPKYNLNYAMADATSFTEALTNGSKDLFTTTNTLFIKDADATKEGMAAAFEKVKAAAKPQDLFVFYYAGHGVINDKNQFFLVPYDVTQLYGNDGSLEQKGFSAVELQKMSKDIKAQKQLFILDACQSAGALSSVVSARGAAEEKAISQLARATGTYWLTASSSEQFASEFSQLGHGSFTYCLLQAFKGDANPGDKKLTVKVLDAYLQTKVPEITQKYKGTVQYPVSYSYGNDFPIIMVK
jgi:WD40 repeat protein